MPTYEYACTACGHAWEADQKMADPPLTNCPVCLPTGTAGTAKKQISRTSFALKGQGWYADGYGATPPPATPTTSAPVSTVSDAKMAAATTCPTKTAVKASA